MKIFSKTLTERTARIVADIEKAVILPVKYHSTDERPNKSYSVAGSVDPYGTNGVYSIWLDPALPPEPFEADLLHELRHIMQIRAGFSEVCNKETDALYSKDQAFIQEVGSRLSSVVLDIEVNRWLAQMGYSSAFFAQGNLKYLLENAGFKYPHLEDPLNFANVVLTLLGTACDLDDPDADKLCDAYCAYPDVVETVRGLRQALLSMPLDSPHSTALAHSLLIDTLNLWGFYYAEVGGRRIRTRKEYLSFCGEAGFSPDI